MDRCRGICDSGFEAFHIPPVKNANEDASMTKDIPPIRLTETVNGAG